MTSATLDAVAVVGCGLIGGSIATACSRAGVRVYLDDVQADRVAVVAAKAGASRWDGEPVDLVVVAVPPSAVVDVVAAVGINAPTTPITDVASAKSGIVTAIDSPWFVGGHPMAGAADAGPAASDGSLFADRVWVTCARQRANSHARAAVSALIAACGAREVHMSADDHDRAVAVTSHAVQMAASALAVQWSQLPGASHVVRGRAFDEVMRLAGSDPHLWEQIAAANSGALAQALLHLADQLTELADGLAVGDATGVATLLEQANAAVKTSGL